MVALDVSDAKPRLPAWKKLVFAAVAACVVLLVIEGACLLFERPPKTQPSERLVFELTPGYSSRSTRVNALGLRGPEIQATKPAGVFRILCMGGSTTYGHGVTDEQTWPALLEHKLREAGWSQVQVINGGVFAWGMEHILVTLGERRLAELQPDLVLVYSGWNHPSLDSPQMQECGRKIGTLDVRSWWYNLATVRRLERIGWKLRGGRRTIAAVAAAAGAAGGREEGAGAISSAQRGWAEGFEATRRARLEVLPGLVDRLVELTREQSTELAFVKFPALVQAALLVQAVGNAELRARYEQALRYKCHDTVALEAMFRILTDEYASAVTPTVEGALRAGVPLLEVADVMAQQVLQTDGGVAKWIDGFFDRLHLSPVGNGYVAEALVGLLLQKGLLPAKPATSGSRLGGGVATGG